jgi:hypothetical protein
MLINDFPSALKPSGKGSAFSYPTRGEGHWNAIFLLMCASGNYSSRKDVSGHYAGPPAFIRVAARVLRKETLIGEHDTLRSRHLTNIRISQEFVVDLLQRSP